MRFTNRTSGLLWIVLAAVLWGTIGVATRGLYATTSINALTISTMRLTIAAPLLLMLGWGKLRQRARTTRRRDWGLMLLSGALTAVYQSAYIASIAYAGVTITTLIAICTAPLLVSAFAIITGREPMRRSTGLALVLGLVGVVLVVGLEPERALSQQAGIGVLLAFVSGLGYGIVILLGRSLTARVHPLHITGVSFSAGAVLLLLFTLVSGQFVLSNTPLSWLLLVYLGAVPTALSYSLFVSGMRSTPATVASIIALLDPVTAALLAALLFGERLTALGIIGAGLLLLALLVLSRRTDR